MSDEDEIASLLDDMRSGDESRLIEAAMLIAQFGPAAIPGLLETLESPYALSRDYSAMALGLIRPPAEKALPELCKASFDTNPKVRFAAVAAIHNIAKATPMVIDCLNSVLSDPDEATRNRARMALNELGRPA